MDSGLNGWRGRNTEAPVLHLAVVSAADGVRFTTVAPSAESVAARIGEYVRRNAGHVLWPADAARVLEHLASGRLEPAIALYFGRVGERWDPEYLHRQLIDLG